MHDERRRAESTSCELSTTCDARRVTRHFATQRDQNDLTTHHRARVFRRHHRSRRGRRAGLRVSGILGREGDASADDVPRRPRWLVRIAVRGRARQRRTCREGRYRGAVRRWCRWRRRKRAQKVHGGSGPTFRSVRRRVCRTIARERRFGALHRRWHARKHARKLRTSKWIQNRARAFCKANRHVKTPSRNRRSCLRFAARLLARLFANRSGSESPPLVALSIVSTDRSRSLPTSLATSPPTISPRAVGSSSSPSSKRFANAFARAARSRASFDGRGPQPSSLASRVDVHAFASSSSSSRARADAYELALELDELALALERDVRVVVASRLPRPSSVAHVSAASTNASFSPASSSSPARVARARASRRRNSVVTTSSRARGRRRRPSRRDIATTRGVARASRGSSSPRAFVAASRRRAVATNERATRGFKSARGRP
mmetsp:Transcript_6288/g.25086  ORF Transcript_6288/g.25086 Transcript_6288/m.25086 type:complete len:436 (-) Transcript_6288:2717-4024(-)